MIAGEALIDMIGDDGVHFTACEGGSPFNLACCLAHLGNPVTFASSLSRDHFGDRIHQKLLSCNVSAAAVQTTQHPTSLALAKRLADGSACYSFYLQESSMQAFDWQQVRLDENTRHLHLGSYLCCSERHAAGARAVVGSLHSQLTTSLDINVRLQLTPKAARVAACIDALLAHLHIIKASDEDLATLFPGQDAERLAQSWLTHGPILVVITRGGDGGSAYFADEKVDFSSHPVQEVTDTIGCGDVFMAGLLHGLLAARHIGVDDRQPVTRQSLLATLDLATKLAAYNCTVQGASSPSMAILDTWLKQQDNLRKP